jgi:hypothetical protein
MSIMERYRHWRQQRALATVRAEAARLGVLCDLTDEEVERAALELRRSLSHLGVTCEEAVRAFDPGGEGRQTIDDARRAQAPSRKFPQVRQGGS